MEKTALVPFVKDQIVWRPAPCGTRIQDGVIDSVHASPSRVFYHATFGEDRVHQTWENLFFHTQAGALKELARRAREKAHIARLEVDKWDSVWTIALARAGEDFDSLPNGDARELQNDGDPIRDAAIPVDLREYVVGTA